MKATVKTKKLRGQQVRRVEVYSNDPIQPKLALHIKVDVLASVQVLPRDTVRMTNRQADGRKATLVLRRDPREKGELVVQGLSSSAEWLDVSVIKLTEPRPASRGVPPARVDDWLLEIAAAADAPYKRAIETVSFQTGLTYEPKVEVQVHVDLAQPVRFSPRKLELGPATQGAPVPKSVRLTVRHGLTFEQLQVEAVPDTIRVELQSQDPRRGLAKVVWDGKGEREGAALVFRVGDESVTLPVTWNGAGS